jgi:glutathione S-transferase
VTLTLYAHPLASYCWKVLIALYENGTAFENRLVDLGDPVEREELVRLSPLAKFPLLRDSSRGVIVAESSIIVEYLDHFHPGAAPMIPSNIEGALDARFWDRIFDNYVQGPMQEIVADRLRGTHRDSSQARATLRTAYAMVDRRLSSSPWMAGSDFGLADCAAAPALFYASTLEPFPTDAARLAAYFERLVARPSVARTLEEAKPHFQSYPFESAIPTRFR